MDPEAFAAGMKMAGIKPKRKRGRPKGTRAEAFQRELERCEREGIEVEDSRFLMERLGRIVLGPVDLGPLNVMIGRRVKEICDIAIDKAMD